MSVCLNITKKPHKWKQSCLFVKSNHIKQTFKMCNSGMHSLFQCSLFDWVIITCLILRTHSFNRTYNTTEPHANFAIFHDCIEKINPYSTGEHDLLVFHYKHIDS